MITITEINAFKEGTQQFIISILAKLFEKSALKKKTLWPLFMDGVQLPQG